MKLPRRQFLRLGAGAAALSAIGRVACAETYPTRPIRLVVPFPPGGAFDTLARVDSGFEASPDTTPEKFRRRLEADVVFWTPVVEALGLKIY